MTVAALYVDPKGAYAGLPGVECWGLPDRDARDYAGPWPVVAHPPCARWSSMARGGPRYGGKIPGEDGGAFAAALVTVRRWGGVLEHPAHSKAWTAHDLRSPPGGMGWWTAGVKDRWVCEVAQADYGHRSAKLTWLYVCGVKVSDLPKIRIAHHVPVPLGPFGLFEVRCFQRPSKHDRRDPLFSARRREWLAYYESVTGRAWCCPETMPTKREREATPPAFRDLLISMARSAVHG